MLTTCLNIYGCAYSTPSGNPKVKRLNCFAEKTVVSEGGQEVLMGISN